MLGRNFPPAEGFNRDVRRTATVPLDSSATKGPTMYLVRGLLLVAGVALLCLTGRAADSTAEQPTLMTERGKLLFSDDFDKPLGKEWKTAKGKWEVADGAIKGAELKADMH